jgi:hypothetical protein
LQLGKCVVLTLIATVLICNVVVLANIGVVLTLIATGGEGWRAGKGWFSCLRPGVFKSLLAVGNYGHKTR